ncbi:MAG: sugar phosphate isomerase/epimerase [Planctomyces sp.]|nr:sugar phosphate isomerase/epimerase [Planctomyces sp.]
MSGHSRRRFLHYAALTSMATAMTTDAETLAGSGGPENADPKLEAAQDKSSRKFTMDLRTGSIGVGGDQLRQIELAAAHGFESVNAEGEFLVRLPSSERREMPEILKSKGLVWGAAGLTVEFRRDETTFADSLKPFTEIAQALKESGVTRVGTWLMPFHQEMPYVANFRQHARRLRECSKIMQDHGLRFGMEYVGPKTLWASSRHSFIHSMVETKELIAEIGLDNVGIVLDSWHWYTAHESLSDLLSLKASDVVACDLNDAPSGKEIDQQIDSQRELPMATGVIDLKGFLGALIEIGYDGPVRAEPFNAALNAMDDDQATAATATAMKSAFSLVDGDISPGSKPER